MRTLEPWVGPPLEAFLSESSARLVLLMTSAGQVVAQHGFSRSLDVMAASALGAGIVASTAEVARLMGEPEFGALVHQSAEHGLFISSFDTPRGRWIALVVFGQDTTVGLVQLFFSRLCADLRAA
ncbi:MAG TPA: roadblock/LC7 domain-containing protein, partial [Gemmatimonadales bacterium]|nr:roadblock/LC7 domain-containing protein [Gemmatimonadales bacterium]